MPQTDSRKQFDDILNAVILDMAAQGHPIRISSRDRTADQQAKLFTQGRRGIKGEQIVTEKSGKPGDESRHQLGTAADIVFEKAGDKSWDLFGQTAKKHGLKWGGDWDTLKDYGHIQLGDDMPQSAVDQKPDKVGADWEDKPPRLDEKWNPIVTTSAPTPQPKPGVIQPEEAGDFAGGFWNAMRPGGEADQAALQGLKGFFKGAVTDLPGNLAGMVPDFFEGAGRLLTHPVDTLKGAMEGAKYTGANMADTTMAAGGHPEEFGRMTGNITGQPLVVEAGLPYVPPVVRGAGRPIAAVGKVMAENQPLSGMLPPFMTPRTARMVEGATGRGIQAVGEAMKKTGTVRPKVVPGEGTTVKPPRASKPIPFKQESRGTGYTPKSSPMIETGPMPQVVPGEGQFVRQLDPSSGPIDIRPVAPDAFTPSYGPTMETGPRSMMSPGEGQVVSQVDPMSNIGVRPPTPDTYTPSAGPMLETGPRSQMIPGEGQMVSQTDPMASVGMTHPQMDFYNPSSGPMIETGPRPQMVPGEGQIFGEMDAPTEVGMQPPQPSSYVPSSSPYEFGDYTRLAEQANKRPPNPAISKPLAAGKPEPSQMGLSFEAPPETPPAGPGYQGISLVEEANKAAAKVNAPLTADSPFAAIEARMMELTRKGSDGTLTGAELQEAQALNKIWRQHPEFGTKPIENPTPGQRAAAMSRTETAPLKTAPTGDPFPDVKIGQKIRVKAATPERLAALKQLGFDVVEKLKSGEVRLQRVRDFLKSEEGSFNLDAFKKLFKKGEEKPLPPRMVPDSGGQPLTIEGLPPLDVQGMATPQPSRQSVFSMTPQQLEELLGGVYDAHGRYIAPKQTELAPRPPGNWDTNFFAK